MRKKLLILQNNQLFDRLNGAEKEIQRLKKELIDRDGQINELKKENERLLSKLNATEPLKTLEAKVVKQASVTPEVEYGASVIGKIVIEAAKACNRLTADGKADGAKELINLILGRTEVAKSEILNIVSSEYAFELKKEKIDSQFENAADYFCSVMAQRQ